MTLSAVLFDVDGTLADTERDGHRAAFNQAFKEFQLDWNWDIELYGDLLKVTGGKERIRHYLEHYSPELLGRNNLDEWIASIHKVKTKYFLALLEKGKIPLRPGVERLIQQLRLENIRIAIATTTTHENVTTLLRCALGKEAPNWFDVIGAGDIVSKKKPSPDIYHWVLDQLGLPPQACIAIEDSGNGLQSAMAAGLKTVITYSEYSRFHDFNGAVMVLPNLEGVSESQSENANPHEKRVDVAVLRDLMTSKKY